MIDLKEWEFVATNGLCLVGKTKNGRELSPVFEVLRPHIPVQVNGQQNVTQAFMLRPFLSLAPGVKTLRIPEGALRVGLDTIEVEGLANLVEQALDIDMKTRAQAAGIHLVQ